MYLYRHAAKTALLALVTCGCLAEQPAQVETTAPALKPKLTVLGADGLKLWEPKLERIIEVELEQHDPGLAPSNLTALFKRKQVSFGQFVGTTFKPDDQTKGIYHASIKVKAPEQKGKYEFTCKVELSDLVSKASEAKPDVDVSSEPLHVEVK